MPFPRQLRLLIAVCCAALCLAVMQHKLSAQAASIAGKWHFVLETEGGDRNAAAEFQQEGDKVSGKWDNFDVKGTFADGKLDLEFPVTSEEAGPGTLVLKGQLQNGALTGTWTFQSYNGNFKATRAQ